MSPKLRLLAAISVLTVAGALAGTVPAADATAGAPAKPPSGRSASTASLAAQVARKLRGSKAPHIDYKFSIPGVGTIGHDATSPLAPASNQKLFTTVVALRLLGPNYRYQTKIFGTANVGKDHTLHGSLILRGAGDPTLTIADLERIAKRLHANGLHNVTGHLIVDDSRYSHQTLEPGWKHSFVPEESGTVDAFSLNQDEWRGGKSFDADPTKDNALEWRTLLKKEHIHVAGKTEIKRVTTHLHTLLVHESPSLSVIIDDMLTNSVNYFAEMLLREVGAVRSGHGSAATGIAAEHAVAAQLGLPLGTVYDGSGLSYADRESPATITDWLLNLETRPTDYGVVYAALPLSCETGTLEGRLCTPSVRGRVRAKTGTLNHHTALSGYLTTASGRLVTFSIIASGFKDGNYSTVRAHVDAAITVVAKNG